MKRFVLCLLLSALAAGCGDSKSDNQPKLGGDGKVPQGPDPVGPSGGDPNKGGSGTKAAID